MSIIYVFLFSIIVSINLSQYASVSQQPTLKLLIEVTRHGARSPLYDNFTTTKWEIPPGHLTTVGQRQHYLIGRELKKRYMRKRFFLNKTYDEKEVVVHSTDYIRTIQSAQSQLLGLYYEEGSLFNQSKMNKKYVVPPINVENVDEILQELKSNTLPFRFQPIPVKSKPDVYDQILSPGANCEKIAKIIEENQNSEYYLNFEKKMHEMGFYQQFGEIFKVDASNFTIEQTQQYLDIITMNKYDNKPLPENYTEDFDNLMNFAYCFRQYYLMIGNDSVLPYFVSKFFENLLVKFEEKLSQKNESKLKLEFFSAHDNNLIYILRGLGVTNYTDDYEEFLNPTKYFSYQNPPLASILLFELHEINNEFFVRILFNDIEMKMKDCEKYCNYEIFKTLTKKLILDNWEQQCKASPASEIEIVQPLFLEKP